MEQTPDGIRPTACSGRAARRLQEKKGGGYSESHVTAFADGSYTRVSCVMSSTQNVTVAAFFFLPPETTATPDASVTAEPVLVYGNPSAVPLNATLSSPTSKKRERSSPPARPPRIQITHGRRKTASACS